MKRREAWATGALRDRLDVEGRPLGEIASPLYPTDTREVRCPYAGSREGRPMNAAALAHWRAWRDRCLATWGSLAGPTVRDTWRAATACIAAPLLTDGPLPVSASILYKTTVGFHQTLTALLLDTPGLADRPAATLGSGEQFLTALEAGGWLAGRKQACAGPPGDIAWGWEALTGQRAAPPVAPLPVAPPAEVDAAVEATALAVALTLSTLARLRAGDRDGLAGYGTDAPDLARWPLGARLWHSPATPWLVAATARPDRDPRCALHLHDSPAVSSVLAARSHAAAEAAFHAAPIAW